ncbi:uncharacterized protein LOC120076081 [Benincasa hispida]|uniref:uncharacterized protein LOC120076081 n=1 Tax=Benincasa hispida TaxID=102211 RepID=UPI0018FF7738|nr:uncharacterized protein LOC120076081 [Benincasa hispida]
MTTLVAQMATLTSLLQTMAINQGHLFQSEVQANALTQVAVISYIQCREGHLVEVYPLNPQFVYSIHNEPFGNTYNPGWRNHQNFSWGGNHNQGGQRNHQNSHSENRGNPPVFLHQNQSQGNFKSIQPRDQPSSSNTSSSTSSLETLLKQYIKKNEAIRQSQASSIRNLEVQIGQLAIELKNKAPGTLPSSSEAPGRSGKEQCQALTLRSGKKTVPMPSVQDLAKRPEDSITNNDHSIANNRSTSSEATTSTKNESQQDSESKSSQPPAPKTQQARDLNENSNDQEIHINIPLVEALEQMSSYVKFLKDILAKKRKIGENETVTLTYECSALFQNNIPTKMKDPGSFTLPCSIGGKEVENVLCDLGASINLMPLSIFKKLNIGNTRPTTVKLQLADRTITHPEGKIEDVLVQVDKFILPADFIILDYQADTEMPIILGHPFLATGRALIDVQKGELTIRVDDQQVKFNVLNALEYPGDMENYQYVGELQKEQWHEFQEESEEEDFEIGVMLEENCAAIQTELDFETIKLS